MTGNRCRSPSRGRSPSWINNADPAWWLVSLPSSQASTSSAANPSRGTPPSLYAGEAFRRCPSAFLICGVSVSKVRFFPPSFVVIFGFDTTFNRISYSTRDHDCHESHSLLLILVERLVEWLPSIGDLFEVGRTLTQ